MFAEIAKEPALLLGGRAGDLRRARDLHATLVEIIKACLDDPSAFEKGVVKDPVEFTQAEVNRCVLFGWNGVLNNADMCHHLLMMLVPRCSAPPNPDRGSPLRGSSRLTHSHTKDPVARRLTPLVNFYQACHV